MTWRRHTGPAEKFHAGAEHDGISFATLCNGFWPLSDETEGRVEHQASPPQAERCEFCQRQRIEQLRIERGLAELEMNTRFDVGGES